jgi:hypothetical protein
MSDALVGISIKMVFAHYDLGIVIRNGERIAKFPVDCCLFVQVEGYLDI